MSSKAMVVRKVIFFVLIFLLFYLGCKSAPVVERKLKLNNDITIMLVGLLVTVILIGVYYLANHHNTQDNYRAFEISPGALCRGGPYMWQGDSERARFCRGLASSVEGVNEISKFNCPTGFEGLPKNPVKFSSNSDSCWNGIDCNKEEEPVKLNRERCSMVVNQ